MPGAELVGAAIRLLRTATRSEWKHNWAGSCLGEGGGSSSHWNFMT